MQEVTRYLADNKVTILINLNGFVTEYRPVYNRNINVYKGIDNTIHFEVKNHDQKNIDITDYTPKFVAFDENKTMVLEKDGTVLDDATTKTTTVSESVADDTLEFSSVSGISVGQTVTGNYIKSNTLVKTVDTINNTVTLNKKTSAVMPLGTSITFQSTSKKGVFTIQINENDLLDIKQQYLSYMIYLVDSSSNKVLTYTDSHFGAAGTIYVSGEAFPGPSATYSVKQFDIIGRILYYDSLDVIPEIHSIRSLHTAAIYSDTFAGEITIQGTLENQITQNTNWADVTSVVLDNEDEPYAVNFNGVFSYIRFVSNADPTDKISQILVRN